jgi:hypothetical protein
MPCSARLRELTQQALTTPTTMYEIGTLKTGSLQRSSVQPIRAFSESISNVNISFALNATFSIGFGNGLALALQDTVTVTRDSLADSQAPNLKTARYTPLRDSLRLVMLLPAWD